MQEVQHGVDDCLTPQEVRESTQGVETELLITCTLHVGELHRGWKQFKILHLHVVTVTINK